jgi:hypothetical protein
MDVEAEEGEKKVYEERGCVEEVDLVVVVVVVAVVVVELTEFAKVD